MFQINLKAARVNAGLSRREAAAMVPVAPGTLARWESGRTYPRADQYRRLCQIYHCPVDAVFLP